MYQRPMLVAALIAALGGSAAAQSLAPSSARGSLAQDASSAVWNQLVKVYPNDGTLGSAVWHYVLTSDVLITKDWGKLKKAVGGGNAKDAKKFAHENMSNTTPKPTKAIVDLALDAVTSVDRGTPPYVDIQTMDDYGVEVSKVGTAVIGKPKNTLRIHLDVPINSNYSDLETALSSQKGCDAYAIIWKNIPAKDQRKLIEAALKTALGC
jgi:hypothetical protein